MAPDELGPESEDLRLHHKISARERVDSILKSEHLTLEEGVAALNAQFRENQATFRHVVIARVDVSEAEGNPGLHTSFIGPFADRRTAEAWAEAELPKEPRITHELAKIETGDEFVAWREHMRRVIDGSEEP
jgi:hypothetical protein